MKPINADIIKTALLAYYRYKRQMLAVDEAGCNIHLESCDVLVDAGTSFFDIEIKISKADLWKGEAVKHKHCYYKKLYKPNHEVPNYFIICVPSYLIDETKKWVESVNPKYGIIEFDEAIYNRIANPRFLESVIRYRKKPQLLHKNYSTSLQEILIKRLVSAYTTLRQNNLRELFIK